VPLRDYTCPNGHHNEVLEPVDAPTERPCACGETARRGLSAPAFALKGAGWFDKGRPVASKTGP
jgi:putative FmdB family regulatory protein